MILAMGAEHTNPNRLKQVVDIINKQRIENNPTDPNIYNYIEGTYGVNLMGMRIHSNYDYMVEEKYDGYSYINDGGRFFSKRLSQAVGNEGMPIEKTGHLPHLSMVLHRAYEHGGLDLHGEIYIPGGISDDITRILGCTEDEAVRRTNADWERRPRYMLIDIRKFHNKSVINEPWYIRRALLEYAFNKYIVPYNINNDIRLAEILHGDPRNEFKRIVTNGGEGIIIKNTNGLYIPGKKPANNWIKGKKKITLDVVIMGFNDGTGKNKQLFGSFEFGLYINGKLTKKGSCSSGLNDAVRQMVAANPEQYIGTVIEIEAIQESAGSFRNAVFLRLRDDKDAIECTPLNITIKDQLI